jgi:anti-anti-sigma regulatory factor
MANFLTWLTTINTLDTDLRRRGRNVALIGAGMAMLLLFVTLIAIFQNAPLVVLPLQIGTSAIYLGAIALARSGRVNPAALLTVATTLLINLAVIAIDPTTPSLPFFLTLGTLLATVLLPPAQIWAVLFICIAGAVGATSLFWPALRSNEIWSEALINSSILMAAVAIVGYLSASGVRAAMAEAEAARRAAAEAGEKLTAANAALEQRVEDRTAALRQIAEEHRTAAVALAASLEAQQELNRIIAEQAVPVIPVSADTLVVPLIGNIGGDRADEILVTILEHVERTHARTVVLDVTGVALVDTHVAAGLLRVAQATRLMGTTTVLAGIRPEVAQALVGLGVDLADLHTVATLKEALRQGS